MREEYNSVLSAPIEADNIGRFGRYRYIGKTQILVISNALRREEDDVLRRALDFKINRRRGKGKP